MLLDTSVLLQFVRESRPLPARTMLSVIVAAELQVFAIRLQWQGKKLAYLTQMRERFPPIEITDALIPAYAHLDAYSQGKLLTQPLPRGMTARNMGKNDLWLASTALFFDTELYTADNDFDHLQFAGVRIVKY